MPEAPRVNTKKLVFPARLHAPSVASMQPGARSPEELETLLEDAFLGGEHDAVSAPLADGAILARAGIRVHAYGSEQVAREAAALCEAEVAYIASPKHVLQARNTVLV